MSIATRSPVDRLDAAQHAARRISERLRGGRHGSAMAPELRVEDPGPRAIPVTAATPHAPGLAASPDLEEYGLEVDVATVTPAVAAEWLKCNTHNRKISSTVVRRYERIMKERKWRLNGEPVIFDRLGRLVNGQQRLTACLMSDTPFRTLVVRGVEPEAFDTLDNGKKRTGADVLGIDGHVNTSSLSSAAILLIRYEQGTLTGEGGRYAAELYQVRDTVAAHPGLHESVQVAERLRRLCAKSAVAFCHYAFGRIDPEATGAFFEKLDSGADLAPGDPILVLRNRLAENRASAAKLRTTHVIALFFKAFNFAREGRKLGKGGLRWKAGIEDFPTLNP